MIHIETKDKKMSITMAGDGGEVICELAYGVAQYFVTQFQKIENFDPVASKQEKIADSVEDFSELLFLTLVELYDRNFHTGKGGPLQ